MTEISKAKLLEWLDVSIEGVPCKYMDISLLKEKIESGTFDTPEMEHANAYWAREGLIQKLQTEVQRQRAALEAIKYYIEDDFPNGPDGDCCASDGYRAAYKKLLEALSGIEPTRREECDWCGEIVSERSYPHMFDMAIGKRMCRGCWDHDREVYKGSYGEDIGSFKPVKEGQA